MRVVVYFFFNDTAPTEIYPLPLHDALPVSLGVHDVGRVAVVGDTPLDLQAATNARAGWVIGVRSEEHTSELQSRQYLVCRLLLEKKKTLTKRLLPPH